MGIIDFLQPWTMSKVAAMCHGIGIWVHLTALKKTVDIEFSTWFIHYTYYYITYMILDPIGKFWQVHQVFRVQQGGVHCDSMPKTRRSAWIYAPWQATVPPPLYGKRPTACDTLCDTHSRTCARFAKHFQAWASRRRASAARVLMPRMARTGSNTTRSWCSSRRLHPGDRGSVALGIFRADKITCIGSYLH